MVSQTEPRCCCAQLQSLCGLLLQAEALSTKSMQMTADKAAVESNLALKEDEVCFTASHRTVSYCAVLRCLVKSCKAMEQ